MIKKAYARFMQLKIHKAVSYSIYYFYVVLYLFLNKLLTLKTKHGNESFKGFQCGRTIFESVFLKY